jgi:hypothetical protein
MLIADIDPHPNASPSLSNISTGPDPNTRALLSDSSQEEARHAELQAAG